MVEVNSIFCLRRKAAIFMLALMAAQIAYPASPTAREWIKATSISGASLALTLGLRLVPTPSCSWCASNSFDLAITRAFEVNNLASASASSDVITFALLPGVALGGLALFASPFDELLKDGLVVLSSVAATAAITDAIKISARRMRPKARFGTSLGGDEDNRSFLSGHTSFSFSLATSASVLAFRHQSRFALPFASLSMLLALSSGVSRIIANKHWATDVIAGMGLGIMVGAIMPGLILDASQEDVRVYLLPDPWTRGLQIGLIF